MRVIGTGEYIIYIIENNFVKRESIIKKWNGADRDSERRAKGN